MKNIYLFYVVILIPLVLLFMMTKHTTPAVFVTALVLYIFVYRTFTDGMRLYAKGKIAKKDIWRLIIPGYRFRYFKDLYWV